MIRLLIPLKSTRSTPTACLLSAMILAWGTAAANDSPYPPVIIEPSMDGIVVNAADVHMETAPFTDPDPGDTHVCSDFEIWTVSPSERIWSLPCVTGPGKIHSHLGDGTFEGSHDGRTDLIPGTNYSLRIRFRDSSGDPATEWSEWGYRLFSTGTPSEIFPLELSGISQSPLPSWTDLTTGAPLILPASGSPPAVVVQTLPSNTLLTIQGLDGISNSIVNPSGEFPHGAVRVIFAGGGSGIVAPASRIEFTDETAEDRVMYLPPVSVPAGSTAYYWISSNGSSYEATGQQTAPDFSTVAQTSPLPWAVLQDGFRLDVVATGFQLPVNIAFVPTPGNQPDDPLYYVAELYGTVKLVERDGSVHDYATGLLNFDPTGAFPGSGEQGISGIAIDSASGDLFVSLLYDSAPPDGDHYPRIIRLHSDDGGHTASVQSTVIDMEGEVMAASHFISNLSFGPDAKLYVHIGDGLVDEAALDLTTFRGKILRMNPDGSAPPDNPFYDSTDGISAADYLFAIGFRNPFGGVWRTVDSSHFEVENGPDANDRLAKVTRGMSYGWDGTEQSMTTNAIYNWPVPHAPVNVTVIQQSTFGGSGYPAGRMNRLYVTESGSTWATGHQAGGKRVVEFEVNSSGQLASGPTTMVEYDGAGKATAVAIAAGPDGLYFSDFYKDLDYATPIDRGSNILRLRYSGRADFAADSTYGAGPLVVHFQDRSDVPSATAWQWDLGNGTISVEQNPTAIYSHNGLYNVRLTVVGPGGPVSRQRNAYIRVGTQNSNISNGDFESGTDDWTFSTDALGRFDIDTPGPSSPHAGHITIDVDGQNEYLTHNNIALHEGTAYELTFRAYSSIAHDLALSLEKDQDPGTNYGLSDFQLDLTSAWKAFSVPILATGFTDTTSDGTLRLRFNPYAASGDEYFVDDVALSVKNAALTVELSSLIAELTSPASVRISWITLSETNNLGFTVERGGSGDGPFAEIPGSFTAGIGSSSTKHNYEFTDTSVTPGDWWYTLKQLEVDSTAHFSDPVPVSVTTSVRTTAPVDFSLHQNYPNPFNPTTHIRYSLKSRTYVSLVVYNLLGQQVADLVEQTEDSGNHEVSFNASRFPSGIYFYRLKAEDFQKTLKMVLIK